MIGYNSGTIKVTEWSTGGGGTSGPDVEFTLVSLTNYQVARTVSGTVEQITDKDAVVNRTTGTTLYRDQQMQLSYVGAPGVPTVWTSSDEAVATVDSDGFVTHLTTGTTIITATVGAQSLQKTLYLTAYTPSIVDELVDYVAGSLAKSASDAVDDLIEGKSATTALKLFTTQDHTTPTYVRNGDFWGASLGNALCAISPWNTSGGPTRAGVAISDLHIIFAAHYQIGLGATVRFVLADNTVVSRTLVSRKTHPEYTGSSTGYAHDLTVGLLDSPLPAGVIPVKIPPDDYQDYLPGLSSQRSLPALCLDQEEKGLVTDLVGLTARASFSYANRVNWEKRAEFYESKISGDSGNPAFLLVNGELVLLTVWTFGGAGSGTSVLADAAAIQIMMNQLGGNRTLARADLSGFTNFAT